RRKCLRPTSFCDRTQRYSPVQGRDVYLARSSSGIVHSRRKASSRCRLTLMDSRQSLFSYMDTRKESKQEREETKTYLKILDVYRVYRVDTGRCVDSIHPNPRNERSLSGIYSGALPLQSAPSAAIVGGPFACRCG